MKIKLLIVIVLGIITFVGGIIYFSYYSHRSKAFQGSTHLTVTSTYQPIPNLFTKIATFDGKSGLIKIDPSQQLVSPKEFTIEFWVRVKSTNKGLQVLFEKEDTKNFKQNTEGQLHFGNDLKLLYLVNNQFTSWNRLESSTSLQIGNWSHVAIVLVNNTLYLFQDGILEAKKPMPNYSSFPALMKIGAGTFIDGLNPNGGSNFYSDASFEEFRYSNIARYSTDFTPPKTPFAPDSNTLVLYHFDDGQCLPPMPPAPSQCTSTPDSSGNNNTGNAFGNVFIGDDIPFPGCAKKGEGCFIAENCCQGYVCLNYKCIENIVPLHSTSENCIAGKSCDKNSGCGSGICLGNKCFCDNTLINAPTSQPSQPTATVIQPTKTNIPAPTSVFAPPQQNQPEQEQRERVNDQ